MPGPYTRLPMEAVSPHTDNVEQMLADQGHTIGPVRIAFGKSGIAVGFPRDPMLHLSWWAIAALIVMVRLLRRRRS